jgi:hypothetical protein
MVQEVKYADKRREMTPLPLFSLHALHAKVYKPKLDDRVEWKTR